MDPKPPKDPHQYYYHPELTGFMREPQYPWNYQYPHSSEQMAIRELDDIIRDWQGYSINQIKLWDE